MKNDLTGEGTIAKVFILLLAIIGAYFLVTMVIAPAVNAVSNLYNQWQSFIHFIHNPFGLYAFPAVMGIIHDDEFDENVKVAQDLMEGKRPSLNQFMTFIGIILAIEFLLDLIGIPLDGFFLPIEGIFDLATIALFIFGSD